MARSKASDVIEVAVDLDGDQADASASGGGGASGGGSSGGGSGGGAPLKADGFAAPTVYADRKNGGSGNLDVNDPDD